MSVVDRDTVVDVQVPTEGTPVQVPRPRLGSFWRLVRSEAGLMMGRRRNQVGLAVLAVVPIIMAVSIRLTADDVSAMVGFNLGNGLFVPIGALTVMTGFFLPMAIAMVSGDAVAGEASSGTLRYVLTTPVARGRLLAAKYLILCFGALVAAGVVAVVGTVMGLALFGAGPTLTLSGTQVSLAEGLLRVLLVTLYVTTGLCALAAVGLFVSVLTDNPMVTTVVVMIFIILSWILLAIPQLDWLAPWLLVARWDVTMDLLRDPMMWGAVLGGLGVNAAYAAFFGSMAWARFSTKDVMS